MQAGPLRLGLRREAFRATWRASRSSRSVVRVSFDGEDWIHRWRSGALVWHEPLLRPKVVTEIDLSLFTYAYRPRPGDIVLDVGAGAGAEVGPFSRMVGAHGRVLAIEPDPAAFRRLKKLVQLSGLDNVVLDQWAVGATEGSGHLTQDGVASATNRLAENGSDSTIPVPVTTLDSFIEQRGLGQIDYLKMNIEGSERAALVGLARHADIIRNWCIACHDFLGTSETTTLSFVRDWLEKAGLEVLRHPEVEGAPWMGWYLFASRASGAERRAQPQTTP